MKLHVTDTGDNIGIEMPSKNYTIGASEFLREIRDFVGVDYKLN